VENVLNRSTPKTQCRCLFPSRRGLCWLLILASVVAGLWLLHAPALRLLAGLLIVEEPIDDVPYVAVLGRGDGHDGFRCYDVAVSFYRQKPSRGILLIEPSPSRLTEIGIVPTLTHFSERVWDCRHVPREAVSAIHSHGRDDWATAHAIQTWLTEKPGASITLLCDDFRSAHLRGVLDTVLDPTQATRVRVHGLPAQLYDETNWWTSRAGIKAFGIQWLRRLYGWCVGGDHPPPPRHSVDDYQRHVRQAFLEATP
jgi:hypothetical protein